MLTLCRKISDHLCFLHVSDDCQVTSFDTSYGKIFLSPMIDIVVEYWWILNIDENLTWPLTQSEASLSLSCRTLHNRARQCFPSQTCGSRLLQCQSGTWNKGYDQIQIQIEIQKQIQIQMKIWISLGNLEVSLVAGNHKASVAVPVRHLDVWKY